MLKFDSPLPLHIQLKEILLRDIRTDIYDDKIPSERELMDLYQVSRSTVRQAVTHLVQERVLEKVHGKGTFITKQNAVHDWLNTLNSFSETVKRLGMTPGAVLLEAQRQQASEQEQQYLQCDDVFLIARLRTADDLPIAVERHFYAPEVGEQLATYDLNAVTIYDVIEQQLQLVMVEAEQMICCCPISVEDAALLNIAPHTNVLCIERTILSLDGKVLEYYKSYFHPELYSLRLKIQR